MSFVQNGSTYNSIRQWTPRDPEPAPRLTVVEDRADLSTTGELNYLDIGSLDLELGGNLQRVTVAYRTWGTLNPATDNVVLVLHALTGDTRASGDGGWWEPLIGPGRAIDTNRHFVICSNVLGGCDGTTGPASVDPRRDSKYATDFPLITIGDMVSAQRRLVELLGVRRLTAIGGSIGGFQALEWATRHPDLVNHAVAIAASERLGAHGIAAHSEIGRQAIMADPNWLDGDYAAHGTFPASGLALARMAAMVTYQSAESMETRFGRRSPSRPTRLRTFGPGFDIEHYLHHHGSALVQRFDANSYLYLTRAMDLYDLGRDGGDERWLRRLEAPLLLIGIRSDWLFPAASVRRLADHVHDLGKEVMYAEIDSVHGHDAFLKEWDQIEELLEPVFNTRESVSGFAW